MFNPKLKIGQVVSPTRLAGIFQVKTLRASRFIKPLNTLVLITDYTKNPHPDKWIGDTLHYTSDKKLTNIFNSKLSNSLTNHISIHFFQMLSPKEYTYGGLVQLAGDPYPENHPTTNQPLWVFPIQPNQPKKITKPNGLVFRDMEDFQIRGEQAYRDFLRRRANYIGYRVQHREHGPGTVWGFDGTILTVTFDNRDTRTYNFDKSVHGGYLQFLQ